MSNPPSIGLALIAKNEEQSLPTLLGSVEGAFDRVVLVDTGSTDSTVKTFESWAKREVDAGRLGSYLIEHFDWCDDFAAARQHAHARLGTAWEVWADCDDELVGATNLRTLAAQAPAQTAAFIANYQYGHDPHGNVVCALQRERLVRAGAGTWTGRVHEAQLIDGEAAWLSPETTDWIHRKDPAQIDPRRNLRILRAWDREEPDNPRVLGYLGTEQLAAGKYKQAVKWFKRYLALKTGWDEERAQIHRKLSLAYGELGEDDKAIQVAFEAVELLPTWPDSYLTLAEASFRQGKVGRAAYWADQVIERGVPQTLLIINPLEYTVQPLALKAAAVAQIDGQLPVAVDLAEQVLARVPDHPILAHYSGWRARRKKDTTADTVIGIAQVLVSHDEQLNALQVLDAAPHFVKHHPQIVAWRSMLRERIGPLTDPAAYAARYETGGEKPEDQVPDGQVLQLGDALPRCAFLLAGLNEQTKAAA